MKTFYECRVRYTRICENTGREKRVSETYLIDAVSYGEAEEYITDEMRRITSGSYRIASIRPANYSEVIGSRNGDRYYKARVQTIITDDSGAEKKAVAVSLVCASTVEEAAACVHQAWEHSVVPYTILTITESPIVEVMLFEELDRRDGACPVSTAETNVSAQ
jgi:hypothetical protein